MPQWKNIHIIIGNKFANVMLPSTLTCLHVFPASDVMNTVTLVLLSPEPVQPGGPG